MILVSLIRKMTKKTGEREVKIVIMLVLCPPSVDNMSIYP